MFTIVKKFQEVNNYIHYELKHESGKLVGFQNFNEEHFNAIRKIVNPDYLKTKVIDWDETAGEHHSILKVGIKIQAVEYSFEATDEQVQEAGIRYLLDRKRKWATSTDYKDTNPNFELVTVKEAINVCTK